VRDAHRKLSLQTNPDKAILRLARVLARLAAREDHERELANRSDKEESDDLCSTDLQNERSIEDQLSLCQSYAEREGLTVIRTYEDRARSGGSVMGREGLLQMLDEAREKSFDVVIVEALDRLSRDIEDLAGIHKRLSFLGIEIRAVHEGVVNTVLVGVRGLVGQLYREDNAHKVRRGQAGRVKQGLAGGGLTYGYASVTGRSGERVVVEAEAQVIRRIFQEYVDGRMPREIAHDLWLYH
jgi:site-specific DNA recombinase